MSGRIVLPVVKPEEGPAPFQQKGSNIQAAAEVQAEKTTEQAEAAVAAFGSSGVKMLAALDPKNLNSAAAAMGSQAQIMQANAGVFARIMQLMGAQGSSLNSLAIAVKGKLQGLFTGIAAGVAPTVLKIMEASSTGGMNLAASIRQFSPALEPLATLVESLLKMDLAGVGAQLGAGAAAIAEAIMNGDAIAYLRDGLLVASDSFRQAIAGVLGGVAFALSALFKDVDFGSILAGFQAGMIGIGRLFLGIIEQGIAKVLNNLRQSSSVFEKIISPEMLSNIVGAAGANMKAGREGIASGGKQIADATQAAAGQLSNNIAGIPAAFKQGREFATERESDATSLARQEMQEIENRAKSNAATTAEDLRKKFATPAPGQQALNLPTAKMEQPIGPIGSIVSSMAKIGGDIAGPRASAMDFARQQLVAQQKTAENTAKMVDKLNKLQPASTATGSSYQ
jgi:hypothetical protein